jgi:hypothetical protein
MTGAGSSNPATRYGAQYWHLQGGTPMTIIRPSSLTDQSQSVGSSEFEGQIDEVVRGGVSPARKPQVEGGSEVGTGSANALLRQLAGTTFEEVDRLIDELQRLRVHLQSEGQRVQREIVKYAQLSQAAMKSTKVIAEGMSQLQSGAEISR